MKKVMVAMLLGIICTAGCSVKTDADSARFVCIGTGYNFKIIYDRTTGVEYAVSDVAYNCGTVTLLVDADGKPLIYEGEEP